MNDSFLTVQEIAELLQLNQQTVRNWIDQGSLPAVRVGRRVRVRQSDLDRILQEGQTASAPTPDVSTGETLTRAALARHLGQTGHWVDLQVVNGMPFQQRSAQDPRRRFGLGEVERWLANQVSAGTSVNQDAPAPDQVERLAGALTAPIIDAAPNAPSEVEQLDEALGITLRAVAEGNHDQLVSGLRTVAEAANRLSNELERSGS